MKKSFYSLILIVVFVLLPATGKSSYPLSFEAVKNNVQILPQKFSYKVTAQRQLHLGSYLLNPMDFKLSIVKYQPEELELQVYWPATFFPDAEITLKNSSGVVFFKSSPSTPSSPVKIQLQNQALLDLKNSAYFQICALKKYTQTKVYSCSDEFYWTKQVKNRKWALQKRKSPPQSAQVHINGLPVGLEGLVILNDPQQNLLFQIQTTAGFLLDLETRVRPVIFKNIIALDENFFELIAQGTTPVPPQNFQKLSDLEWKTRLPTKDPLVYLLGESNVPMLQDFVVKGPLPRLEEQIFAKYPIPRQTYSSQISIGLLPSKGQILAGDNSKQQDNQWILENLKKGQLNTRDIQVSYSDQRQFIASESVVRGHPWMFLASLQQNTLSSTLAELHLRWWLDTLNLRSGLELKSLQSLASPSTGSFTQQQLFLNIRSHSGFYFESPTWGLRLGLHNSQTSVESSANLLFGIWKTSFIGSNQFLQAGLDILGSGWQSDIYFYPNLNKKWFLGGQYKNLKIKNQTSEETNFLSLTLGYTISF